MIVQTTKNFDKQYVKLSARHKAQFKERVALFKRNPFDETLRNHALQGKKYKGYRSIDIAGDLRALYCVKGDRIFIFGFIGSHSQLYR